MSGRFVRLDSARFCPSAFKCLGGRSGYAFCPYKWCPTFVGRLSVVAQFAGEGCLRSRFPSQMPSVKTASAPLAIASGHINTSFPNTFITALATSGCLCAAHSTRTGI